MADKKKKEVEDEPLADKPELKGAITSKPSDDKSDDKSVDVAALERAPAARPNASSIMSVAPAKRVPLTFYLTVGLVVSLGLNVLLAILFIAKLAEAATYERDLADEKAYVLELKEKLNAAGY